MFTLLYLCMASAVFGYLWKEVDLSLKALWRLADGTSYGKPDSVLYRLKFCILFITAPLLVGLLWPVYFALYNYDKDK